MKPYLTLFFLTIFSECPFAQEQPPARNLSALRINKDIAIDGVMDEAEWSNAPEAGGFRMNFPADRIDARARTIVRVMYNDRYLYVGARLLRASGASPRYVVSSLRRDFVFLENDAFGLIIDPFNDHINGYGFYVSALGVQAEEQISKGTVSDPTWDIKWFDAVKRDTSGYTVEMAIPLRFLRFPTGVQDWNINFIRNDIGQNERSSWQPTPRNFLFPNLSYAGKLTWAAAPTKARNNFSLYPALTYTASQDGYAPVHNDVKPSLDAKVTVTSSLNLDLTLNPDFSEAEVDQAQVNLSRFDISYPEKRLFFIENSDLFSSFGVVKEGSATIQPFYSRNIGLKYNSSTGQYEQTSLIGGARLSGKLNENFRLGAMSVQTASHTTTDAAGHELRYPGENFSVLAVQQKVFSSSNIGVILTNKQAMSRDSLNNGDEYNRLVGVEYNLTSRNGQWTGKIFHETMFSPEKTASAQGAWLNLNSRKIVGWIGINRASSGFAPEMGFVPRNNFTNMYVDISYTLYPNRGPINNIQPVVDYRVWVDSCFRRTDHFYKIGPVVNFKNTGQFYALYVDDYTRLMQPFNPSITKGQPIPAGAAFNYKSFATYYQSDARQWLSGSMYLQTGQYYNGHWLNWSGALKLKIEPFGNIGFNYNCAFIRLPQPYSDNDVVAIGPLLDLSFSRKLFFNSNVQYTSLNTNLNYFFRLQYRFRPLSDLYLVYTNNENMDTHTRQNQSLIVKFVYFM
jgi:hypothetical protein